MGGDNIGARFIEFPINAAVLPINKHAISSLSCIALFSDTINKVRNYRLQNEIMILLVAEFGLNAKENANVCVIVNLEEFQLADSFDLILITTVVENRPLQYSMSASLQSAPEIVGFPLSLW